MVIMNNHLLKLILGLFVFTCLVSCHSHDTRVAIVKNNQLIDSINNHITIPVIDSINIIQFTKNKWCNVIASDCTTSITFKQDYSYEENNCEWELSFEGKYEISKDSVFLYEYGLASDLPDETRIINRAIYTYIYQKDSLRFVSNKTIKNGKVIRTYSPDSPIYYKPCN